MARIQLLHSAHKRSAEFAMYDFLERNIKRYGDTTSNMVEQYNNVFGLAHSKNLTSVLLWIHDTAAKMAGCAAIAAKLQVNEQAITPSAKELFQKEKSCQKGHLTVILPAYSATKIEVVVTLKVESLVKYPLLLQQDAGNDSFASASCEGGFYWELGLPRCCNFPCSAGCRS